MRRKLIIFSRRRGIHELFNAHKIKSMCDYIHLHFPSEMTYMSTQSLVLHRQSLWTKPLFAAGDLYGDQQTTSV